MRRDGLTLAALAMDEHKDATDPQEKASNEADDLIASLADEAIDRMLHDGSDPEDIPDARAVDVDDDDALDAMLRGDAGAHAPSPADDVARELDADAAPAATTSTEDLEDDADDGPLLPSDLGLEPVEAPDYAVAETDAAIEDRPGGAIESATATTPFWHGPLAWLARPLDRAGDPVRDAVGKVALVTLVNGLAVLAYAVVFRG